MGKNILIVPSNAISRTPNRTPYINFINNGGDIPIDIKVLTGATITFSSATQANILVIRPSDNVVSVGNTLNVRNYMAFNNGTTRQVIDGTLNWVGPTTNIAGAQGAQGAQGNPGITITPTNPVSTLTLTSAQNIVYSSFGTKFFNTYSLNGTGTATFTFTTPVAGGSYLGTLWGNPSQVTTVGPLNRTSRWTNGGASGPVDTWIGYSACLSGLGASSKTYYVGIAGDNDFRLELDSVDIVNTLNGPLDGSDTAFKWWNVYAVTLSGGNHTLELYGLNRGSVASFGMEIYDNTLAQLTAATTTADLNIIYSSSARTTAEIVQNTNGVYISSGYTCPTGYAWSPCGGAANGICIGYLGNTGAQGATGAQGISGATGGQGAQGLSGATGAQGLSGLTGAQGAQGPKGAQGNIGAQGPVGAIGNTGAQGATGNIGAQGDTGAPGTSGAQGAQGSTGAQGGAGAVGLIGPQGAQGAQGAQGVIGAQGNTGAQGQTGNIGPQGNTGHPGISGPVGAQGVQGAQGAAGGTGNTGAQGAGGATGAQGAQGAVGNTGAQGSAGAIGAQGNTGAPGLSGPVGAQGPTGAQGSFGPTGNTGSQGAGGATGAQGAAGQTGNTGAQGQTGNIGAQGAQGATGNTGAQGAGGATGAQGPAGQTGNTGAQGAGGATGAQGAGGQIGHRGAQGAGGATGAQGNAGQTGNTGAQGAGGATGAQGNAGQTGNTGAQGQTGNIGAQGNTGAQGAFGAQGATGAGGNTGAQGSATGQGAQGGPGPTGAQGAQGPGGPRGPQGAQGGPGGPGPQGAQGPGGPRGSQGPTGAQGPAGTTPGAPGPPGFSGHPGQPGNGGSQGAQGSQGPGGSGGPQGAQGTTGPGGTTCYGPFTWYFGYSISDFCSNICDSVLYYQQITYCNPSYGAHYLDLGNCQSSNCDWGGITNGWYGWCNCGNFQGMVLSYICGYDSYSTFCAYSDVRLKTGIETLTDAMSKIMQIEAVEYDWNENLPSQVYNFYKRRQKLHTIGLIAQNVRLYFPEVVIINEEGYYSINYEKLNAVLVEGIKEQSLFIEDIDKELNEIESKIS
jgi:hypothetical protein